MESVGSVWVEFMLEGRGWLRVGGFGAKGEQHGKRTGACADGVRVIWRKVEKHAGFEPLPFTAEEEIARTVENLHERAAAA